MAEWVRAGVSSDTAYDDESAEAGSNRQFSLLDRQRADAARVAGQGTTANPAGLTLSDQDRDVYVNAVSPPTSNLEPPTSNLQPPRVSHIMSDSMAFDGVYSVLPTPFTNDGELDEPSLRRVVDLFIDKGVNGLTALGVTGEVARLEEAERARVLQIVVSQAAGRVPVVVGTTAEGTRTCISYSRHAKAMGASAVMVSPPRMPKLNSDAVVLHYRALADAVDIPIVVQDYPPISGFFMEPALLARIAAEIPQARTIKLEDPPTPHKTARILEQSQGVPISILGGLGGVFLLEELMSGAAGAMTGFAFPEILVRIVADYRTGLVDRAADLFYRTVPLMRFEFQDSIGMAIRKSVLHRRGAIASPATRPPAGAMDAATKHALDRVLSWVSSQKGLEWISV
jgi:4-hydroxy-tetrahydrodipicolinate synthase